MKGLLLQNRGNFILYLTCALLVILPAISNFIPSQGIAVVQLFSVALAFLWFMKMAQEGRIALRADAFEYWFCIFLGIAAVSVIASPYKLNGTGRLLDILSFALLYIVIKIKIGTHPQKRDMSLFLIALFVSLGIVCLYGIGQFFNIAFVLWRAQPWGSAYGNRIFSTIGNPNWLASFIISILPFVFSYLAIVQPKKKAGLVLSALAVIGFTALVLTNSWAGWGGFAVSLGVMGWRIKYRVPRTAWAVLLIMVVIFTAFSISKGPDIFGDPGHFKERVIRYFAAAKMIAEHPLAGIGLGNLPLYADYYVKDFINMPYFSILWPKEQSQTPMMRDRAENEFLDIGAETGVLGLAAFLLFLFFFFKHAIGRLKKENECFNTALLVGSIGSVSALLFDSLFGFPLHVVPSTLTFVTALALARDGSGANRESVPLKKIGDRFRFGIRTVPTLILCGLSFFIVKGFIGEVYLTKAVIAKNRENYQETLRNLSQAKRYNSTLIEVYLEEGVAHRVLGNYAFAIEPLRRYLKERPYHVLAHYNLGYSYLRLGDIDSAIGEYQKALFLKPRFGLLYESLALAYLKKGDIEKAKGLFGAALQFNPNSVLAYLELDVLGNPSQRLLRPEASGLAMTKTTPLAMTYSSKGTEYLGAGELDLAIAAYKKAAEADLEDAFTLSNIGVAYHAKGMLIQAVAMWRRSLAVEPDNEIVIKNLGAVSLPASLLANVNFNRPLVDVPILMYHRVIDEPANQYEVATSEFKKQMRALKDNGFTALTLAELFDCRDGKKSFPKKPAIITFDDVYEDFYDNAYPILKSYGLKAECFLIADYVGKQNDWDWFSRLSKATHLGWDKIKEASRSGFVSFNCHTATHKALTSLRQNELEGELAGSKKAIEDALGKRVEFLSYPFGSFDPAVEAALQRSGYRGAVSASGGIEEINYANPYELRRIFIKGGTPGGGPQGTDTIDDFLRKVYPAGK